MGQRNILRLLTEALKDTAEGVNKIDTDGPDTLKILPQTDDTGAINVGDGTNDIDVKVFLGASTDYVEFNVGTGQVNVESAEVHFGDNDSVEFGDATAGDVSINWNGTYMEGNAANNAMWDNSPISLDPDARRTYFEIDDDFYTLDTTATVGDWTNDAVGTGTVGVAANTAGGVALLTCQATTDDASEQLTHVSAPFYLAAGKTLWLEARVKLVGDITQSEVALGLVALGEDLTAVSDVKPQDGVAFTKQDGATTFTLTASKNGTNTGEVASVHTLVNDTWVTFGLLIDGVTSVTPYIDGTAGTAATATIPDDLSLAPFFLVRNGDATTQEVLHVDYCRVIQLR